jgi:hypothetical protein
MLLAFASLTLVYTGINYHYRRAVGKRHRGIHAVMGLYKQRRRNINLSKLRVPSVRYLDQLAATRSFP